ncbi:MAG: NAD(P)-dependent oxidoreductase [Chloroflexi bacterium]|nr:NAD(P)-dependent oxidoreductase [Chloroflexota bacterium]
MKLGFIGLGTMGGRMANNLQKAGHLLVVHDVRREACQPFLEKGATWADSPKAVGEQVDLVFTSLPGPPEVEAVALGVNGLLDGMHAGSAWFDLSTNSPTLMRRLHKQFGEKGIQVLDSPVSGGPAGAATGKLAIWVGGDQGIFREFKAVLDDFSDAASYAGPIGAGCVTKLVHNCAGYAIQAAVAEVFTLGVKAGVEPVALLKAVRQGAVGRNRVFDRLADTFLTQRWEPPNFALRLAHKDVTLATELAREVGVPMRVANLALAELQEGLNRGWGAKDSRVAMLIQEERSGVDIKATPEAVREVLES